MKNPEVQKILTSYDSFNRTGTFILQLDGKKTSPIPWDATSDMIKQSLKATLDFNINVEKQVREKKNFIYVITFDRSKGNLPEIEVDTSKIVGCTSPWTIVSEDGSFANIRVPSPGKMHARPFFCYIFFKR